jgi:hypothetical protein
MFQARILPISAAVMAVMLLPMAALAQRGAPEPDPRPIPRNEDGRATFNGETDQTKGLWTGRIGITTPIADTDTIAFKPWARALWEARELHELEPHARCKPSAGARPFLTPYGVEILELPDLQRIYVFDVGGPHTWRTIYMDGRTHPKDLEPSYVGHSIGWWDGDTLVVDTIGFNDGTWIGRRGLPHTDQARTLERFIRTSYGEIDYKITVYDDMAYDEPWTGGFPIRWSEGPELFEYVCQQGNQANSLMLGDYDAVDRTTTIIP